MSASAGKVHVCNYSMCTVAGSAVSVNRILITVVKKEKHEHTNIEL